MTRRHEARIVPKYGRRLIEPSCHQPFDMISGVAFGIGTPTFGLHVSVTVAHPGLAQSWIPYIVFLVRRLGLAARIDALGDLAKYLPGFGVSLARGHRAKFGQFNAHGVALAVFRLGPQMSFGACPAPANPESSTSRARYGPDAAWGRATMARSVRARRVSIISSDFLIPTESAGASYQRIDHFCTGFRVEELLFCQLLQKSSDGFVVDWIGHSVDANRQGPGDTVRLDVAG